MVSGDPQAAASPTDRFEQLWEFDRGYLNGNTQWVVGVDEAGRGCLAGPLVASAVLFACPAALVGVDDSKRLTPQAREVLAEEIQDQAAAWALGWVSEREIDRRGIDWANRIAFTRALRRLRPSILHLARSNTIALIDGIRPAIRCPFPQELLRGGDAKSFAIAAASILAKTARDRYCTEILECRYPGYGFAKHKGYATHEHRRALMQRGPTPCHRRSFSWQEAGVADALS